jgi:hypothetical protein
VGTVYPIEIESPMIRTLGKPETSAIGERGFTRSGFFDDWPWAREKKKRTDKAVKRRFL